MKKLILIFNHKLTREQEADAFDTLMVDEILTLPDHLKTVWNNITPKGDLCLNEVKTIIEWIKQEASPLDYILVQGDFGATFFVVDYCFKNGLTPVYATTKRKVAEEKKADGTVEKKSVFKHIFFRKYVRCNIL